MNKKLEEIFWDGDRFRKSNGVWVFVKSICEPLSISLGVGDEENHKKIEDYINKVLPYKNLDIDAYSKGTPSNNERGFPIQLYKITFKYTDFKKIKYRNMNSKKEFLEILKEII